MVHFPMQFIIVFRLEKLTMKQVFLIISLMATAAFADIKLDFMLSVRRMNCEVTKWTENGYENGVYWKYYAKFTCKEEVHNPPRIVGLKFIDYAQNLKDEYVYTYGID